MMDAKLYEEESSKVARKYGLLKDQILSETVWDLFDKYGFNEKDAAVLSVCINILSAKQTAKRLGGRVR